MLSADDTDRCTVHKPEQKAYCIADLIRTASSKSLHENTEAVDTQEAASVPLGKRKRGRCGVSRPAFKQGSAFKMSNKLAVHGNKPKKEKKNSASHADILWHHDQKLKHFASLQSQLPAKYDELRNCTSLYRRHQLESEIFSIENREEEMAYVVLTQEVISRYNSLARCETTVGLKRDTRGAITRHIAKYDNVEKDRLTEEYCRLVNNGLMIDTNKLIFDTSRCQVCGGDTKISDGFVSCCDCGTVADNSVQDFQFSYKDLCEQVGRNSFSYKRINRFQEILSTLQGKENTEIPSYVMNAVQQEINKELEPDLNSLNTVKIRYYLRKLSLTNYYEHAPHILNKINGIPPIQIPYEVEEKLKEMFLLIQEPFEKVKSEVCPKRISFLSYHFVLYKFCQLLELHEYQHCFTLLKSTDKLKLQDRIWKGICEIRGWPYYPSTG